VSISLNDAKTTIIGPMRFFSTFGVYNISGMLILTNPSAGNIVMKVEAEQGAIKSNGELKSINYALEIRPCKAGEEQLQ
jgi:hypothetical protein